MNWLHLSFCVAFAAISGLCLRSAWLSTRPVKPPEPGPSGGGPYREYCAPPDKVPEPDVFCYCCMAHHEAPGVEFWAHEAWDHHKFPCCLRHRTNSGGPM